MNNDSTFRHSGLFIYLIFIVPNIKYPHIHRMTTGVITTNPIHICLFKLIHTQPPITQIIHINQFYHTSYLPCHSSPLQPISTPVLFIFHFCLLICTSNASFSHTTLHTSCLSQPLFPSQSSLSSQQDLQNPHIPLLFSTVSHSLLNLPRLFLKIPLNPGSFNIAFTILSRGTTSVLPLRLPQRPV